MMTIITIRMKIMMMTMIIIIIIIIIIIVPETKKYWVDVQWGIVLLHRERNSLKFWSAILLEMVSR